MGASASNLQTKVYKFMECGCIYCYDFSNESHDIQMLCHCHNCLQELKNNTFDTNVVGKLVDELSCYTDMEELVGKNKFGWLNQSQAIQEASRIKMRGIDEFLLNTNILQKYNIHFRVGYSKK